jgi:hypothetical protein
MKNKGTNLWTNTQNTLTSVNKLYSTRRYTFNRDFKYFNLVFETNNLKTNVKFGLV